MSDDKAASPVVAKGPVAWRYRFNGNWYFCDNEQFARLGRDAEPLYAAPPVVAGEYDDYAARIASARFTAAYAKRVNEIAKVDPVFLDAMADALAAMQATVILTERQSNVLTVDLHAAKARIAALTEALEFYADRNYEGYQINITDYGLSTDCGAIIEDAGTIARAALKGGEG